MDRFEELKARYARSLPQKATELAAAWQQFAADPHDAEARRTLHLCVHRLSGSAPAFGFEDVGDVAQVVDGQFSDWLVLPEFERPAPAALKQAIGDGVADLVAILRARAS